MIENENQVVKINLFMFYLHHNLFMFYSCIKYYEFVMEIDTEYQLFGSFYN